MIVYMGWVSEMVEYTEKSDNQWGRVMYVEGLKNGMICGLLTGASVSLSIVVIIHSVFGS